MKKCRFCGQPATYVFKAHNYTPFNVYLCSKCAGKPIVENGEVIRYVEVRFSPKLPEMLCDEWEKEWKLAKQSEGKFWVYYEPKARVY